MTIDLILLFNTANCFEQAAFSAPAIAQAQKNDHGSVYEWDIAVATTNSALALELYLKALWVIEREADPPKTHRLDLLFEGLTSETKKELARAYSSFTAIHWTVEQMLQKAAHLFQESRYPHEYSGENRYRSRSSSYELAVPHLFRKRILELRPDLELSDWDASE